jgi:hypothetical protein
MVSPCVLLPAMEYVITNFYTSCIDVSNAIYACIIHVCAVTHVLIAASQELNVLFM